MNSFKEWNELPGMLELALQLQARNWPHTTDPRIWVEKWMETITINPSIHTDEGAMIAWFANAIMAGYDTASRESKLQ